MANDIDRCEVGGEERLRGASAAVAAPVFPAAKRSRVAICICTYKRPGELAGLLRRLSELEFRCHAEPDVEVLVVDNDAAASARAACEEAGRSYPWRLRYVVEPVPGISTARNRALAETCDTVDFVVFIDDDEEPVPCWLDELLRVRSATGADAVIGPVEPRFPPDAPLWLMKGGFFELRRHADGARLEEGITGNALLDAAALRRLGLSFSPALALCGGEDQLFFRGWFARGGSIHYAANAVCHERVAAERLNHRYLLRRQFRKGNSLSICDLLLAPSPKRLLARAAKGLIRSVGGIVMVPPFGLLQGRIGLLKAACISARGMGMLAGLMGYRYREYRRPSG